MQMTDEQKNQLLSIAKGIALKQYHTYKYYGISAEDMTHDLWIKGAELIEKSGKFEPNLIAKALFNDVVDAIRYHINRPQKLVDPAQFEYNPELGVNSQDAGIDPDFNRNNLSHNSTELADLNAVFDEFGDYNPDDYPNNLANATNKEYWYTWLIYKLDIEYDEDVKEAILNLPANAWMKKDKWKDKWPVDDLIACALGYAGNHSSAFQKIKRNARSILEQGGFTY